jgi:hypothetical protein
MLAADRNEEQTGQEHFCCISFRLKAGGYGHETRDMNQFREMILNLSSVVSEFSYRS